MKLCLLSVLFKTDNIIAQKTHKRLLYQIGAEDEIRTRDVHLGKVTLYHWATPAWHRSAKNLADRGASGRNRTIDTGIFSPLLYRLSYRSIWRPGWGSNSRPPAWQAGVLTNWTTGPKLGVWIKYPYTVYKITFVICFFTYYKVKVGGSYRARTCDLLLVRQMLSQLS